MNFSHRTFKPVFLTGIGLLAYASAFSQTPSPNLPKCVPQTQIEVAKIKQQVVLVGEVHGTREIPEFVSGLLCSLLQSGRSVILTLERDVQEQESLNRYITSEGTESDRHALIGQFAWTSKWQDGRSSEAMLALIEDVRRLRKNGQRIGIAATKPYAKLDIPMTDAESAHLSREDNTLYSSMNDRAMADSIFGTAILYRQYTQVVLSGYGHTSNVQRMASGAEFLPMGWVLGRLMPTFTVGIRSHGGEHGQAVGGPYKPRTVKPGDFFFEGDKIDAIVSIPHISASKPANPINVVVAQ